MTRKRLIRPNVPVSGVHAMTRPWVFPLLILALSLASAGCGQGKVDEPPATGSPAPTDGGAGVPAIPPKGGTGNPTAGSGGSDAPAALPDPYPASRAAEAEKQRAVQALVQRTTHDVAALDELEKSHPKLYPHVRTLVVDRSLDSLQRACAALGEMGPAARGATPALLATLDKAADFDDSGAESLAVAAVNALAATAPDDPAVLDRLLKMANGEWLPTRKLPGLQPAAVEALGRVAKAAPAARARIATALVARLDDIQLRGATLPALAACGVAVDEATFARLKKLRYDPDATTRDAADAAVKEIDRQRAVVPQLTKAGIVEGAVPPGLYEAAFALVEGGMAKDALQAFKDAPRDGSTLRVALGLATVAAVAPRQVATEVLGEFARHERNLRPHVIPALITAAGNAATAAAARKGLAVAGVEAIRQLRAKKSPALDQMESELVALVSQELDEPLAVDIAESLGDLRVTTDVGVKAVIRLGSDGKTPIARRAAAQALLHLGPDQAAAHGENVFHGWRPRGAGERGDEFVKVFESVMANMGLDGRSEDRFWASVFAHPKTTAQQKEIGFFRFRSYDQLATAAEVMTGTARQAYLEKFWAAWKQDPGILHRYLPEIIRLFPEESAKVLAPDLADALQQFLKASEIVREIALPWDAAEALSAIGPRAGPAAKKALEDAVRWYKALKLPADHPLRKDWVRVHDAAQEGLTKWEKAAKDAEGKK